MKEDLISKKLGELLLLGYRMLNETCDECQVYHIIRSFYYWHIKKIQKYEPMNKNTSIISINRLSFLEREFIL